VAYLIDADVFIRAKNLHYGFDFCPAFWSWLIDRNTVGAVFSIERVGDELAGVADELSDWAAARGERFFKRPTPAVVPSLGVVSTWCASGRYESSAVSTFLQCADYYLVAEAHAGGHTVVTHEIASASTKKIKIPDACIGLGVRCTTPYEMLRKERARFILGPSSAHFGAPA